jgi:hypothetical protein
MNGFIRAASYSRVSSQRQADEKTIESQLFDIRAPGLRATKLKSIRRSSTTTMATVARNYSVQL